MKGSAIAKRNWSPSYYLNLQRFGILFTRLKRHPQPSKRKIGRAPRCKRFSIECHTHLHFHYFLYIMHKGSME